MTNRQEYRERVEADLKVLNARVDDLASEAEKARAKARQYEVQVEALQDKRDQLRAELDQLQSANEKAWEDLRQGVEQSLDELRDGLARAVEHLDMPGV